MKERRTDIDFSKHVVTTTQRDGLLVHELAVPGTRMNSFTFINTQGILAVTGDYGNWIFCREFHPGPNEYVSDSYWVQKLKISSTQDPYEFDSNVAREEIQKLLQIPFDEFAPESVKRLEALKVKTKEDAEKLLLKPEDFTEEDRDLLMEVIEECKQNGPSEEEREWLQELYDAANEGEYGYIAKAMDRPGSFDPECIPRGKVLNYWLYCIFDAFDEICQRMKEPQ